jgi:retron-type reverse transcriptase
VADFEADLSDNLYKLWNRMSSGSYLPPPVRQFDIPKGDISTEARLTSLEGRVLAHGTSTLMVVPGAK